MGRCHTLRGCVRCELSGITLLLFLGPHLGLATHRPEVCVLALRSLVQSFAHPDTTEKCGSGDDLDMSSDNVPLGCHSDSRIQHKQRRPRLHGINDAFKVRLFLHPFA